MILIDKTFEAWTQEDLEHGDTNNRGFDYQDEKLTFKELIQELEEYYITPGSSVIDENTNIYTETETGTREYYEDGVHRSFGFHYSRDNKNRSKKYWIKALNYVLKNQG